VNRGADTHLEIVESSVVLSASEIGAFTYCPESWVLDRLQAPYSMSGQQRRFNGSFAHRRIGDRIDRVMVLERAARLTAIAIVVLVVVAAFSMGLIHIPRP
jgi:hypothetical protein